MPSKLLKSIILTVAALWMGVAALAQEPSVGWKVSSQQLEEGLYRLTFSGSVASGKHIYGPDNPNNPFSVSYVEGVTPASEVTSALEPTQYKGEPVYFTKAVFSQDVRTDADQIGGTITWQACEEDLCGFPEEEEFEVSVAAAAQGHATAIQDPEEGRDSGAGNLWALILEAILWGLAMLLTPCVFPMVPMTISFFMKQSQTPAEGRFKAFMYGLFIVLLYTVPISVIIGLTWLIGGNAVTADIFNWLATHWLPNIIFFIVFMVFAASFFGAFEIELPSSLANKSDAKSNAIIF